MYSVFDAMLSSSIILSSSHFLMRHPGILLVIIAVAGEVACEWNRERNLVERLKKFFGVLLVVGLILEMAEASKSDVHVAEAEKEVAALQLEVEQTSNNVAQVNEQIASAKTQAADALKDAAQANERAAKFDADRALVEKEAEQIRSTNLELQAEIVQLNSKIQPRTLVGQQENTFTNFLRSYPKGRVFVMASLWDTEATEYAKEIESALKISGFDVVRPTAPNDPRTMISTSLTGLGVVIKDDLHPSIEAISITEAFLFSGLSAQLEDSGVPNFDSNEVDIVIGPRF
jgi:hypothetical protein